VFRTTITGGIKMNDYKIRSLEGKHVLSTIMFLGEHGMAAKTTIYENVSKNPRMPDKLSDLEKAGVVVVHHGYPTNVELTTKGKEIYELLSKTEGLLV